MLTNHTYKFSYLPHVNILHLLRNHYLNKQFQFYICCYSVQAKVFLMHHSLSIELFQA
jgi:hypothetical protein